MIKHIEDRVLRLSALVSRWKQHGNIPRIERDLALDELREIYDALLNVDEGRVAVAPALEQPVVKVETPQPQPMPEPKVEPMVESKVEPKVEPTHTADPVADFDDALDIDDIIGAESAEPTKAPVAKEPEPQPQPTNGGGLFSIEDIPVRKRSGRKIISLYGASSSLSATPTSPAISKSVTPVSQPATQPIAQSVVADSPAPQRLGDVLGSGVKVVGDVNTTDNEPIAPMNKITDLRKAIGVNDKFLLLRDLFVGDVALYERTIDALNSFEDLDECMIYIVENFQWNPDSEGAKMLVELIERKLS